MAPSQLRRRFLLSSTVLVAAIANYGRRAYAACANVGGSTYQCSGANTTTQTINANNASVSTIAGFSVDTSSNSGITITGDGAISYTDTNASPVNTPVYSPAVGLGLRAVSYGQFGGTLSSVTVKTNGEIQGTTAVTASSAGVTSVSLYGNIAGAVHVGTSALGTDLNLYTAPGTVISRKSFPYDSGIRAYNGGTGSTTVRALSDRIQGVVYTTTFGHGDTTIITNTISSTRTNYVYGIVGKNYGTGSMSITANGLVKEGLYAFSSFGGGDINVTLNFGVTGVSPYLYAGSPSGAVFLRNYGVGAINLNMNALAGDPSFGNVIAINRHYGSTDLKVTVGAQGATPFVTGTLSNGAFALRNYGSGVLTFTSYKGLFGGGISALNYGTDLTITASNSEFAGGIHAINHGTGALSISLSGASSGINYRLVSVSGSPVGIYGKNYGTDLSITTTGGAYVRGTTHGIQAINKGSGTLTISTGGPVFGDIVATNYGTGLGIIVGTGTTVTGDVTATNKGTRALIVTANGNVTGDITAINHGTSLGVTTATGTTVGAITATNNGTGLLAVAAYGAVTGGISATDYGSGLTVISAGAISGITGINAVKHGSTGALSITTSGDVTGNGAAASGILAKNYGTTLGLTLGAGKTVSGATGVNALNYGSGGLTIMANGNVTGTAGDGIYARSSTGAIGITVASGSTVKTTGTSASNFGIETKGAAATITVAGTVAGGAGGAGISGANLTVRNSGTISGNTTAIAFTGGTNTLTLQSGWSLSGGINLATNTTSVTFNQSIGATLANVIGGSGSVIQNGSGILTLAGTNTFSGGTKVDSGTLAISNNSALGTGALTLSPGTTLHLEGVSITNQVNVSGDPDIAVTGTNSMPTFAGAAGTTTNILGTDNSATTDVLTVTTANAGYAGLTNVGGTAAGSAVTLKGGALNAFGSTSAMSVFTGSILDLGGFNQAIGSLSGVGTVTDNGAAATLTTGDGTNTTFDGVLQDGSGVLSMTKAGSGIFTLSGANTFNGATTIDGGTLIVNGSTANSSLTTINSGGTLSGIGTIGSLAVTTGGTFAPGSGIAGSSMTVTGNATFQSGAIYQVNLNAATASFATIGGTALLNGTVNAIMGGSIPVQKQYTILTALGGLGGSTFSSLNTNAPAGFTVTLDYDLDDVFLSLTAPTIVGAGLSGNQANVLNAINTFFNNGGALPPGFVSLFGLTGGALGNALSQFSGEPGAAAIQSGFGAAGQFMTALFDSAFGDTVLIGSSPAGGAIGYAAEPKLPPGAAEAYAAVTPRDRAQSFEEGWKVWATGYGGSMIVGGDAALGSNKTTSSAYGAMAGATYRASAATQYGFALGGAGSSFGIANGLGSGKADIFNAAFYAKHIMGPAYLAGALAYGWHGVTTDRTVTIAGSDRLHASFDANALTGRIESGWTIAMPVVSMTPYAALQSTSFFLPSYGETATSGSNQFALDYAAQTVTATRGELGLHWEGTTMAAGGRFTWRATTAWAHDWHAGSIATANASFQSLPGSPAFIVNGAVPAHDLALVSAGVQRAWANGWSLSGTFLSELASTTHSYGGKATLSYAFN
jgi:uncharacterized protein with beta-barrel porin domain